MVYKAKYVFDVHTYRSSSVIVSVPDTGVLALLESAILGRSKASTAIAAASQMIAKFGWLRAEFTAGDELVW